MENTMYRILLLFIILLSMATVISFGQVPRLITHQGYLTNSAGVAIDTTLDLTFKLYQDSTGGSALWQQTFTEKQVIKGVFSENLGPIDLPFNKQYWLEVQAGSEVITPRTKFTSAPYALRADIASSVDTITNGKLKIKSLGDGNEPGITLYKNGDGFTNATLWGIIGDYPNTSGSIAFHNFQTPTSGTKLIITKEGDVGIGNTAPGARLDIGSGGGSGNWTTSNWHRAIEIPNTYAIKWTKGSTYVWGLGQTSENLYFIKSTAEDASTGPTYPFYISGSTSYVGINTTSPDQRLSVNGGASKPGGGSWSTFSDIRLKTDIKPFHDGLSVIRKINPITYRYNGKTDLPTEQTYIGILAQEIQPVAPYTISRYKQKLDPTDTKETELLSFNPDPLTYVAVNALKELDSKVTELEKLREENRSLSERLDHLEMIIKSLTQKNDNTFDHNVKESSGR
jgi:hypothetical protein